jgi:hypothetical protein
VITVPSHLIRVQQGVIIHADMDPYGQARLRLRRSQCPGFPGRERSTMTLTPAAQAV